MGGRAAEEPAPASGPGEEPRREGVAVKQKGRRAIVSIALLSALFAGSAATAPSASAYFRGTLSEKRVLYLTNMARRAAGRSDLHYSYALAKLAKKHSALMASKFSLFHTYNLAGVLSNFSWTLAGENVGMGPGIDVIQYAFMHSPEHKANILERRFHRVGIGVVWKDGIAFVTVDFLS
jgi:uncharacterized protein YkwD